MRDKRYLPIQIALILSAIVLLLFLKPNYEIMYWVIVISVILIGLLIGLLSVFFVLAQFIKSLRQPVWLTLIPSAMLVYLGVLTISLSKYKELVEQLQTQWDIRMVALGFAVVSFGFGLFMQTRPKQQNKLDNLDEEINELSVKIQGVNNKLADVNNKLSDLERTANVFLKQSHRLGRRLTSKGGEQNDVD